VKLSAAVAIFLLCSCSPQREAAQTGERFRRNEGPAHEQAILDALNRLRTNPEGFADFMESRTPFYQGSVLRLPGHKPLQTREGARALTQAVEQLDNVKSVSPVKFSAALRSAALAHAQDIGRRGVISHDSKDGSGPRERMTRFTGVVGTTGEAISFGLEEAEDIVIELVVDDGVPSRAHRKLLLNPDFRYAGAACAPHSYYKTVCVIDLAQSVGAKTPR